MTDLKRRVYSNLMKGNYEMLVLNIHNLIKSQMKTFNYGHKQNHYVKMWGDDTSKTAEEKNTVESNISFKFEEISFQQIKFGETIEFAEHSAPLYYLFGGRSYMILHNIYHRLHKGYDLDFNSFSPVSTDYDMIIGNLKGTQGEGSIDEEYFTMKKNSHIIVNFYEGVIDLMGSTEYDLIKKLKTDIEQNKQYKLIDDLEESVIKSFIGNDYKYIYKGGVLIYISNNDEISCRLQIEVFVNYTDDTGTIHELNDHIMENIFKFENYAMVDEKKRYLYNLETPEMNLTLIKTDVLLGLIDDVRGQVDVLFDRHFDEKDREKKLLKCRMDYGRIAFIVESNKKILDGLTTKSSLKKSESEQPEPEPELELDPELLYNTILIDPTKIFKFTLESSDMSSIYRRLTYNAELRRYNIFKKRGLDLEKPKELEPKHQQIKLSIKLDELLDIMGEHFEICDYHHLLEGAGGGDGGGGSKEGGGGSKEVGEGGGGGGGGGGGPGGAAAAAGAPSESIWRMSGEGGGGGGGGGGGPGGTAAAAGAPSESIWRMSGEGGGGGGGGGGAGTGVQVGRGYQQDIIKDYTDNTEHSIYTNRGKNLLKNYIKLYTNYKK